MSSTFSRAFTGFLVLTTAISLMAYVALWAIEAFGGGAWWASLLVVLLALSAEIMIYSSTLHEPIYDWIKEPKRLREKAERDAEYAKRDRH